MHVTAVTEGEIEQDVVQFNAHVTPATLFFCYKNIFYKNITAEIRKILRIF